MTLADAFRGAVVALAVALGLCLLCLSGCDAGPVFDRVVNGNGFTAALIAIGFCVGWNLDWWRGRRRR